MPPLLDELVEYYSAGGYVMPPLLASAILLWYALGYRFSAIKRSRSKRSVRALIDRYQRNKWKKANGIIEEAIVNGIALARRGAPHLRRQLDDLYGDYHTLLNRYAVLTRTLVAVTPLLGLLGTVAGMVETFDSLGEMTLFTQSGGIAGGISQALITTQLGLAIAIPGLLFSRFLEKRQQRIETELAQIKDILCSLPAMALRPTTD